MRVPISYALNDTERVDTPVNPLGLIARIAHLRGPDLETFACLRLAREAGAAGGTAPCTLNAANEVAVHAFLEGRLAFLDIARVIDETLASTSVQPLVSFDTLTAADAVARDLAADLVRQRAIA